MKQETKIKHFDKRKDLPLNEKDTDYLLVHAYDLTGETIKPLKDIIIGDTTLETVLNEQLAVNRTLQASVDLLEEKITGLQAEIARLDSAYERLATDYLTRGFTTNE